MFANFKNRFIAVIAPDMPALPSPLERPSVSQHHLRLAQQEKLHDKFAYARPPFLQLLTPDELKASADHNVRPIIVPRDISLLPWGSGYAECVNSGKSEWNEDQAAFCSQVISDPSQRHPDLPYTYFGIFDGHAGYGAALAASHQFHHILHEKLVDCSELLLPRDDGAADLRQTGSAENIPHPIQLQRQVAKDELIVGALESAFFHMDALIAQDRNRYRDAGGCTACVALFIAGKMFIANAGDSRALLCQRDGATVSGVAEAKIYPSLSSHDHTPETERTRLLGVATLKPQLLYKQYSDMEYAKRPHNKDLGQRILCRQGTMRGWTYKTLTRDDLRMPVVTGEGKRSRLLGTLGVTRGFGDHDLLAINTGILIKPFLTPQPDVQQRDLTKIVSLPCAESDAADGDGDYGVLVMATDGLWDVSENETVARTVFHTLAKYPTERHRYTMVAQELVARARGKINQSGHWRLADSKAAATVDDISVIVIPVQQYYKQHLAWEQRCAQQQRERLAAQVESATLVNGVVASAAGTAAAEEADVVEEDENGEEIVAESSEHKEQARVLVEEDVDELEDGAKEEEDAVAAAEAAKASHQQLEAQINAAVTALEATELAADTPKASPQSSPEKTNKKNNRNRKDKR